MPETPQSSTHPKHVQIGLYIFAFAFFSAGFYKALHDKAGTASVLLVAAFFVIFLVNPDKIEHIKGLGFEAKMRTLNAKMDEAQEIVRQLRALAVSTARHIITLVSCGDGYTETYSKQTAWEMVEAVRRSLVDLGIAQTEIDEVLTPYHQQVLAHFKASFRQLVSDGAARVVVMHPASREAASLSAELKKSSDIAADPTEWRRIAAMVASFKRSTPDDVSVNQQEMVDLADDLAHWQATHQLRRPQAYFS